MKNWILALGALSVVGSGCSPVVLEPLQGTQSPESPAVPATTSGGGAGGPTLLAMRGGDVIWNANSSFSPENTEPWSNPDSLVLFFSIDPQECSAPVLARRCTGAAPFWQLVIAIPPELDHPGSIDLQDYRINVYWAASLPDGTMACGNGEYLGPLFAGTLEIISDGSTSLSVKLSDGVNVNGTVIDGDYTGQLCGALPPVSPPTPALAIRGVDLPAAPGGGATPDPDSLVVFLGTLPDTCQDPWAAADCTTASRLTFTLPLALQKPGLINLSDPAIAATYTVAASLGSSSCGQPSGPFANGTIEILSSDAGGLTFKVYQSFPGATSPSLAFDGLYSASICP